MAYGARLANAAFAAKDCENPQYAWLSDHAAEAVVTDAPQLARM